MRNFILSLLTCVHFNSTCYPKLIMQWYVKDATTFIKKLKSILELLISILVLLDLTSLYINFPHAVGMEACTNFLDFLDYSPNNSPLSCEDICIILKLILEKNYFQFNNTKYIYIMGTTMCIHMTPSYAFFSWLNLKMTLFTTKSFIHLFVSYFAITYLYLEAVNRRTVNLYWSPKSFSLDN